MKKADTANVSNEKPDTTNYIKGKKGHYTLSNEQSRDYKHF